MIGDTENNPKKLNIWLPLLLSLVLVGGMLIGTRLQQAPLITTATDSGMRVVNRVETGQVEELIRYIEAKYVDEVDRDILIEKAITELLNQLDPHSNYIPAKQLREVNEQLEGNFEGIGIEFMMIDDTIRVVSPISGGPSESVGILAADKIVTIEDSVVAGIDIQVKQVVDMLRGQKGSEVKVGIMRGQEAKVRDFIITRDEIPLNSVEVAYKLDAETGYIKISRFSANTYKEFMDGLEVLVDEGIKDLVIDVRQNPGGYLQEATKLLSQLFDERGKLLVYTKGRTVHRNDYETTGKTFFDIRNVAVLIDEGSASASEIVAGAIQDHDRGIIVGRRSFGKGLVQEQYGLRDGSALRLTVARYYTPSGRSIQKDYEDQDNYDADVYKRYDNGELLVEDSIPRFDTMQYFTDNGRAVFGGGGIRPDIFVPIDTLLFNDYYIELRQLIPQFVYRYTNKQPTAFDDTSLDDFIVQLGPGEQLLNEFIEFAESKGIQRNTRQLNLMKSELTTFLKARVARHLFKDEGFYHIWNEQDVVVKAAVKAIKSGNPLLVKK